MLCVILIIGLQVCEPRSHPRELTAELSCYRNQYLRLREGTFPFQHLSRASKLFQCLFIGLNMVVHFQRNPHTHAEIYTLSGCCCMVCSGALDFPFNYSQVSNRKGLPAQRSPGCKRGASA